MSNGGVYWCAVCRPLCGHVETVKIFAKDRKTAIEKLKKEAKTLCYCAGCRREIQKKINK